MLIRGYYGQRSVKIICMQGWKRVWMDTIIHSKKFISENPWYIEVSSAPLLAQAMHSIHMGESVSKLYE